MPNFDDIFRVSPDGSIADRTYVEALQQLRDENALREKLKAVMFKNGKPVKPARLRMHYGAIVEVGNIDSALGVILRGEAALIEQETATAPPRGRETR